MPDEELLQNPTVRRLLDRCVARHRLDTIRAVRLTATEAAALAEELEKVNPEAVSSAKAMIRAIVSQLSELGLDPSAQAIVILKLGGQALDLLAKSLANDEG